MKAAIKYDFAKHEYKPCAVPDEAVQYSENPYRVVICAKCGKNLVYAESYCSLFIHAENGFGYCICKECMQKECRELHDTHFKKENTDE